LGCNTGVRERIGLDQYFAPAAQSIDLDMLQAAIANKKKKN